MSKKAFPTNLQVCSAARPPGFMHVVTLQQAGSMAGSTAGKRDATSSDTTCRPVEAARARAKFCCKLVIEVVALALHVIFIPTPFGLRLGCLPMRGSAR